MLPGKAVFTGSRKSTNRPEKAISSLPGRGVPANISSQTMQETSTLFFVATERTALAFSLVQCYLNDPVLAVAQPFTILPQMILFGAGTVTDINGIGVGRDTTGMAVQQKQQ